jgi:hypothetical protein
MDQQSIVIYLALKRLSGRGIHVYFVSTLGSDAAGYKLVRQDLRDTHYSASNDAATFIDIPMVTDEAGEAVPADFGEIPFASVRQLSWFTLLSSATVFWCPKQSLRYTARHLRSVPYIPLDVWQAQRVEQTDLLLQAIPG